mmetsp:Transcript_5011/g.14601  ORF Transcript_5011/g.14601 Transcript_5011/m.14601 type:complete len:207 (-) Transcript_5011:3616-4236(-)
MPFILQHADGIVALDCGSERNYDDLNDTVSRQDGRVLHIRRPRADTSVKALRRHGNPGCSVAVECVNVADHAGLVHLTFGLQPLVESVEGTDVANGSWEGEIVAVQVVAELEKVELRGLGRWIECRIQFQARPCCRVVMISRIRRVHTPNHVRHTTIGSLQFVIQQFISPFIACLILVFAGDWLNNRRGWQVQLARVETSYRDRRQ